MKMEDFDFISDEKFKILLRRDILELKICLECKATKSVLIMAGSVIEAILLEYFTHYPPTGMNNNQVLQKLTLANLIDEAHKANLISSKAKDLCSVVRNYRNLIHPGKEIRTNENYDYDTAVVASSLVNIIIKEVKENYLLKYGYRAENVYNKILNDESANVVFEHLLEKINQNEKNKLLEILTKHQLTTAKEFGQKNLEHFFNIVKFKASQDKLLLHLKGLLKEVEQGEESTIIDLFELYGDCLDKLEINERDFILKYVYNITENLKYSDSKLYSHLSLYIQSIENKKAYFALLENIVTRYGSGSGFDWLYLEIYNKLVEKLDYNIQEKIKNHMKEQYSQLIDFTFYEAYDEHFLPF